MRLGNKALYLNSDIKEKNSAPHLVPLIKLATLLLKSGAGFYIQSGTAKDKYTNSYWRDENHLNPLHHACLFNGVEAEFIHLLLSAGALPNSLSKSRETYLHLVASNQRGKTNNIHDIAIAHLLIKHGVPLNLKNNKGKTCLQNALECKNHKLALFFILLGANVQEISTVHINTELSLLINALKLSQDPKNLLAELVNQICKRNMLTTLVGDYSITSLTRKSIFTFFGSIKAQGLQLAPNLRNKIVFEMLRLSDFSWCVKTVLSSLSETESLNLLKL